MATLSFEEWLYRKSDQYAHSEILAFLIMVLGMNLLIGGLVVTVITVGGPNMLFNVVQQPLSQSSILGLILTIAGFLILSGGFVLVIHYDKQRSWHLKQIEKSNKLRNRKVTVKTPEEFLKELTNENPEK